MLGLLRIVGPKRERGGRECRREKISRVVYPGGNCRLAQGYSFTRNVPEFCCLLFLGTVLLEHVDVLQGRRGKDQTAVIGHSLCESGEDETCTPPCLASTPTSISGNDNVTQEDSCRTSQED